jgi:hypothetical protein
MARFAANEVAKSGRIDGSFENRSLRATIRDDVNRSREYMLKMRNDDEGEWVAIEDK